MDNKNKPKLDITLTPKRKLRFWNSILKTDTCWLWMGNRDLAGYGRFYDGKKQVKAYRLIYELFIDKIPQGLSIDHLCRNKFCVNPGHLEPVTKLENLRRSPLWTGNKTHCSRGHIFNNENTYIHASSKQRVCRPCQAARMRERRQVRRLNYV